MNNPITSTTDAEGWTIRAGDTVTTRLTGRVGVVQSIHTVRYEDVDWPTLVVHNAGHREEWSADAVYRRNR